MLVGKGGDNMTGKEKIVHDLALIYAQEKFHEHYQLLPQDKRNFPNGISQISDFYRQGVMMLANNIDEIMQAYLDDDGNPIIRE